MKAGNVLGAATNGTTQTAGHFWDEIIDTVFTVSDANEVPQSIIWNSKLARQYAKAVDSTGQPLEFPAAIENLNQITSNQIPPYTQGTMANKAADLFAGDFSQVLIGQRLDIQIQPLYELFAGTGEVGILATWRGDVQVARPGAVAAYRALRGA